MHIIDKDELLNIIKNNSPEAAATKIKKLCEDIFDKKCSHGKKYFVNRMIGGFYWCPDCNKSV